MPLLGLSKYCIVMTVGIFLCKKEYSRPFFAFHRHKTDPEKSLVINVEYNQLDPLLKTQGDCKGDVPDPATGLSPYPGNANNIVIRLDAYAKTLRGEDQGVVVEFVNPKYKDETRTEFKKATRLECMMQDIPKLFQKELGSEVNIGFTMFDRWFTFSPAKVRIFIAHRSSTFPNETHNCFHPHKFQRIHSNLESRLWRAEASRLERYLLLNQTNTFKINANSNMLEWILI